MNNNHLYDRQKQRSARALAKMLGRNYQQALEFLNMPLMQGILGEPLDFRRVSATLEEASVRRETGAPAFLGKWGLDPESSDDVVRCDSFETAERWGLIAQSLQMFHAQPVSGGNRVGSYRLKHILEVFLAPSGHSYLANGEVILVALALGLEVVGQESGPNAWIGLDEDEVNYLRRLQSAQPADRPKADNYRPPGLDYLQQSLATIQRGDALEESQWVMPEPADLHNPFHDWLVSLTSRKGAVGHLANSYRAGVQDSDHGIARSPAALIDILEEIGVGIDSLDAAQEVAAEWADLTVAGYRPAPIASANDDLPGSSPVRRLEFPCPCGDGSIIEEHDDTPGLQEHDVLINCTRCERTWEFVPEQSVPQWRIRARM